MGSAGGVGSVGVSSSRPLGKDEKVKIPQVPEGGEEGGFVGVWKGAFLAEGTASSKALR